MSERPLNDPLTDNLAELSEADRDTAMVRFRALRPHVQDGVPLAEAAQVACVPLRTMQRWVARYLDNGLAGLARRRRADAGQRRLPAAIVETIKTMGIGTHEPYLSTALGAGSTQAKPSLCGRFIKARISPA